MTSSTGGAARYAYIDTIRAIAILGVMTVHVAGLFKLPPVFGAFAGMGLHGVQMFFVASALTLMMSWQARAGAEPRPCRAFYLRRLFRIVPMFWLALAAYTVLHPLWTQFWQEGVFGLKSIVLTGSFVPGWLPDAADAVVPGGWSIGIEMNFYLLFPLLAGRLTDFRRALLFSALTVIAAGFLNDLAGFIYRGYDARMFGLFLYFWLPNQLPCFALGFLTFHAIGRLPSRRWLAPFLLSAAIGICVLVAFSGLPYTASAFQPITRGIVVAGATILLVLALALKPYRLLVNPLMSHIGKISFSAYLVHFLILELVKLAVGTPTATGLVAVALCAATFILVAGVTIACSTVSYNYIEAPMIAFGNRFLDGRRLTTIRSPQPNFT